MHVCGRGVGPSDEDSDGAPDPAPRHTAAICEGSDRSRWLAEPRCAGSNGLCWHGWPEPGDCRTPRAEPVAHGGLRERKEPEVAPVYSRQSSGSHSGGRRRSRARSSAARRPLYGSVGAGPQASSQVGQGPQVHRVSGGGRSHGYAAPCVPSV